MKVWFKRGLFGLVTVVIVTLVGLAVFLLTFDPNAYKSKLEEIIYNRYHRTLQIGGDIQLSLFPRIGLSVQGVSLSERYSRHIFASVDSARFAVAIWPLMSDRLVVDHVAVSGFKAWLTRDKEGDFNFQDLVDGLVSGSEMSNTQAAPARSSSAGAAAPLQGSSTAGPAGASRTDFQIDIAGLDLKNGEIHFLDEPSASVVHVVRLDVNTGRMTFDQPFDVTLTGKLLGESPQAQASFGAQALVKMNPQTQSYSAQKLNVQVSGLLGKLQAKSATLKGNMAYSGYSQMVTASNVELLVQGAVQGARPIKDLDASLSVPQLKIDRSQSEFKLEKLALRAKGAWPSQSFDIAFDAPSLSISPDAAKGDAVSGTIKLSGSKVVGLALGLSGLGGNAQKLTLKELKLAGTLKQDGRAIQLNVSSPANWDVFQEQGGLSAMKGDVKFEDTALPNGGLEFPLIGSLQADLVKDEINSEINAIINGSKLDFKVKARRLDDPKVVFSLQADALDFNKFFPLPVDPAQATAPAGKSDAGKPAAAAAKPASKASAKSASGAPPKPADTINLTLLNSVDISGNVKIRNLKVRAVQAERVSAAVHAAGGKLKVTQIAADLYQGKLRGQLSADAANAMTGQFTLEQIAVGDLWQSLSPEGRITGIANLKFDLNTQGATPAALVAGLNGSVQAQVRNGAIKGFDLTQTMREVGGAVQNVFSGQVPDIVSKFDAGRQTAFSSLDANIGFVHGQGTVTKLNMIAPMLRVSEGSPALIDLVQGRLDMVIKARVVNVLADQAGKALADLTGATVPLHVSGPFNALKYQVQWTEIGSRAVKQAVQNGLLDLLSNQAGKELVPHSAKEPSAADAGKSGAVKSIGNALKGLLGQ